MGKPYRGTYNNSEKQKYDEEMLAALEDEQMEVEQKLLRRYCGKSVSDYENESMKEQT